MYYTTVANRIGFQAAVERVPSLRASIQNNQLDELKWELLTHNKVINYL